MGITKQDMIDQSERDESEHYDKDGARIKCLQCGKRFNKIEYTAQHDFCMECWSEHND
jgi:hypothetical protein